MAFKQRVLSHVQLFTTPWTVALQVPLSMEFPRQEYWSGFPFSYARGTTGTISHGSEGWKSEFNMLALLSASEDPLQGCRLPASHCILCWQRAAKGEQTLLLTLTMP